MVLQLLCVQQINPWSSPLFFHPFWPMLIDLEARHPKESAVKISH